MDTFYFGRLSYTSKYPLLKLLETGNKFRPEPYINYRIFDMERLVDIEIGTLFTGILVKYKDYVEEEVVKDNQTSIEYIKDSIMGKCRFFLTEKTHLIAYNPYGNIINSKAFCEAFSAILMAADDTFGAESMIYPVNQEYEFIKYLETMQSITKLTITLTPSNPNNRDIWIYGKM